MVEMEKAFLKKLCRDHDLYVTPSINDKLYLHYKGFRCIKNLEEYTGLKVLWLEGNGLPRIEGLTHQTQLKTLYLQENLIQKIENLDAQLDLDTLNLSQNQISRIENLSHMSQLTSLTLKSNYLVSADDLAHVLTLPKLAVLDIQSNRINDPKILEILAEMPSLKVLYLQGNDVVKHIKQYRKTMIYRCRKLKYLDDRPVFDEERRRVEAWGQALEAANGDYKAAQEAEREEMDRIRQEKRDRDHQNFLMFEEMMAEGRRKRQEDEADKAKREKQEETPEINPFSGEKIVPIQDYEFLQRQREQRWEQVVNAPDAWGGKTQEPSNQEATENEGDASASSTGIPVDAQRLEILHQCATVGVGTVSGRDAFVESAFQVSIDPGEEAKKAHRERIQEKAKAKVQALQAQKQQQVVLPPATCLINTVTASDLLDKVDVAMLHPMPAEQVLMPPPAPARMPLKTQTTPPIHTNVDELD
ncbi:hypothetical protein Poli38472_009048 [Pythium oligandrum]|uniref:Dynein assembly factor 1, axonemal homolog n=1 Tax=Pythium oligandrum TaxID=41045 RepID=A0A8K1CJQ4_PYTOL|nr:hypothetical protein Poli38472_009048 [Pythium oligandrum]|eukprot:TMW64881.1 hypothetical protein Poli38472_009048 [Pythium oligandrum]